MDYSISKLSHRLEAYGSDGLIEVPLKKTTTLDVTVSACSPVSVVIVHVPACASYEPN